MKKPPALYVVSPEERPDSTVARLPIAAPMRRETSWRDLVRRLAKNPLKRR